MPLPRILPRILPPARPSAPPNAELNAAREGAARRRGHARLTLSGLVLIGALAAGSARAVLPDEILPDAGLEARARGITAQLRCPVCQGESIDDSNAPISRDLRLFVRERLMQGDSDSEVFDAVALRFGEFVLFRPKASGSGLILWLAGPGLLLGGLGLIWLSRRRTPREDRGAPLSAEETARLARLLRDGDGGTP